MTLSFTPSSPRSIGMELELQLLDKRSLDLVDGILPLMEIFPDSPYIKPEFIQNTVEIASQVCESLPELETHVRELATKLTAKCEALGIALCGAGTHPFAERLALITPMPRYLKMKKAAGLLSHMQITFATHVHIGMSSGDEAIAVMSDLKPYLPVLIAVSANSPFWRGYDTAYASYRHRILSAARSYGNPPTFNDWNAFCEFFETTARAGIFETVNDIHWDIRPRPLLGTVEVRVMDAQSTVLDAVALAGFVRALVFLIRHESRTPDQARLLKTPHWWTQKENHFQASRRGLRAKYISDERGSARPLIDVVNETLDAVSDAAVEAGAVESIEHVRAMVRRGSGYQYQRDLFEESGSMQHVVAELVSGFTRDCGHAVPQTALAE